MGKCSKNQLSILLFIAVVLCLSLGYALLNSDLAINGSAGIHNASWNVYWDNVQVSSGSVEAETPVIDTNKTTITYSIHLREPGDYYEFTVDAKNDGTLDAMIGSISSKINGNPITSLPDYLDYKVSYSDGVSIEQNHLLKANSQETYKVRVEYKKNIDPDELPKEEQRPVFSLSIEYIQADEEGEERYRPFNGTIYSSLASGVTISINSPMSSIPGRRSDPMNVTEDVFIKFEIENDVVVEMIAGFRVEDTIYYLTPGGATQTSNGFADDSIYYEANKQTIINAYGMSQCTLDTTNSGRTSSTCQTKNGGTTVYKNGDLRVGSNTEYWACGFLKNGTEAVCNNRI